MSYAGTDAFDADAGKPRYHGLETPYQSPLLQAATSAEIAWYPPRAPPEESCAAFSAVVLGTLR